MAWKEINRVDREVCHTTVHGVAKSQIQLSDWTDWLMIRRDWVLNESSEQEATGLKSLFSNTPGPGCSKDFPPHSSPAFSPYCCACGNPSSPAAMLLWLKLLSFPTPDIWLLSSLLEDWPGKEKGCKTQSFSVATFDRILVTYFGERSLNIWFQKYILDLNYLMLHLLINLQLIRKFITVIFKANLYPFLRKNNLFSKKDILPFDLFCFI